MNDAALWVTMGHEIGEWLLLLLLVPLRMDHCSANRATPRGRGCRYDIVAAAVVLTARKGSEAQQQLDY